MRGQLVVTADDLGLTDGVNRAVGRAHRDGIVTSASLLAVGRSYRGAVELVRQLPTLAVGVHLAAVGEDPPLLPAAQVPSLVDRAGAFPLSYRTVLRRALAGRLDGDDVRREFRAQIERVLGDGIAVSHLDTHQHLHLWPAVGSVVAQLACEYGIPAVRLPRSHRPSPLGRGVNALAGRLCRRLDAAGLRHPDDFAGLDEAGAMDRYLEQSLGALARGAPGTAEVNVHPGEADDPERDRFSWGYRWADELAVLTDPATRARVAGYGFRLTSWAQLAGTTGAR